MITKFKTEKEVEGRRKEEIKLTDAEGMHWTNKFLHNQITDAT